MFINMPDVINVTCQSNECRSRVLRHSCCLEVIKGFDLFVDNLITRTFLVIKLSIKGALPSILNMPDVLMDLLSYVESTVSSSGTHYIVPYLYVCMWYCRRRAEG